MTSLNNGPVKVRLESSDAVIEGITEYVTLTQREPDFYTKDLQLRTPTEVKFEFDNYTVKMKDDKTEESPVDPVKVKRTASFELYDVTVPAILAIQKRAGIPDEATFGIKPHNSGTTYWSTVQTNTLTLNPNVPALPVTVEFAWSEEV